MSGPFDAADDAATPLTAEEMRDLIPAYIATRADLNAAEQIGIATATAWAFERRRDLLDERFMRSLHRRMLGAVWRWAGKYRLSERNIGIDHWLIPEAVRTLCDDVRTWLDQKSWPPDEIAVRLHHRLVAIHPFANGNGRHARLMADLLIVQQGGMRFSWGAASLVDLGDVRTRYVTALRAADRHRLWPILDFARS